MTNTLFITGASTGIGAATARAAVDAGWRVGLFARSRDKLDTLANDLGDAAMVLPGDVTERDEVEQAVSQLVDTWGGLNAVFANAGMGIKTPGTEQGDPDEWHQLIQVNILGVLYTVKAAIPHLKSNKGHIILTGSAAGRRHISGSVYGASKWFIHGYAGNLAEEVGTWGGRVTTIAPGMVDTPFFDEPKPDKLQPQDVADAVMLALNADPRCAVREVFLMPTN